MQETIEQFRRYFHPIWSRRWLVLWCTYILCVLGWSIVALWPNKYRVRATIQVERSSMLEPLLKDIAVQTDIASEMAGLMRQMMLVPKRLESIAHAAGLSAPGDDAVSLDTTVSRLEKAIKIESIKDQKGVYTVTYDDSDPGRAKRVMDVMIDQFIADIIAEIRADSESTMQVLDEQITDYKKQVEDAAFKVKKFKQEHADLLSDEGRTYYMRTQEAKREYQDAMLTLQEAEQEVETIRDQAGSLEGGAVLGLNDPLDTQIQTQERLVWDLQLRYTDQHPHVVAAKRTLEHLKEKKMAPKTGSDNTAGAHVGSRSQNPAWYALLTRAEAKAAALQSRTNEYKRRWEELQQGVSVMPQLEAELANLNRDLVIREDSYQKLVARREAAIISEKVEKASDLKMRTIEPPRMPTRPVGPYRLLLSALVLVASIVVGVGIALFLSFMDPIVYTRYDLRVLTDIPILGNISTDRMLEPEEAKTKFLIGIGVLLSAYALLNVLYILRFGFLMNMAGALAG